MKNRQFSLILFLVIQLYIYTMLISYNNLINTSLLSLISTLLCFIVTLFMYCKTKDYFIMITAFFLTLIGDIFFIYFENLHLIGLIFLNIVQLLYFLRSYIESDYKKSNIITRIISIPITIILGYSIMKSTMDAYAILWFIYMNNIFVNIIFTIKDIGINNFFPIGLFFLFIHGSLLMFLKLDSYTIVNVPFINFLNQLSFDIKTIFYLPAQVILTCSVFTVNRKSYTKIPKEDN